LPRLKRLRQTGRESRGRAQPTRIRRFGSRGREEPVRRSRRRDARLLEAAGGQVPRRRRSARAAAGLSFAAGAVVLAACGGGSLSHADFVKHADAICSAYRAGAGPLPSPRTYGQVVAFADRNLPLYEAALERLEALRPPARDEPQAKLWLSADRRVAAAVRALGEAALRRDFPGVTAASARLQAAALASSRNANQLGLQVCGRL
jgi:hypothetical protein